MISMLVSSKLKTLILMTCMKSLSEDGEIPNLLSEEENKVLIKLLFPLKESVIMIIIKNTESLITLDISLVMLMLEKKVI